jgi:hypothetical protein
MNSRCCILPRSSLPSNLMHGSWHLGGRRRRHSLTAAAFFLLCHRLLLLLPHLMWLRRLLLVLSWLYACQSIGSSEPCRCLWCARLNSGWLRRHCTGFEWLHGRCHILTGL